MSIPEVLFEFAAARGGYFSAAEAREGGVSYRQLSYHVSSRNVERVAHGVYRLRQYPMHIHGDLIVATLWAGEGSAVSHDSALSLYQLASAMPSISHVTVSRPFRGRRRGVLLHHAPLARQERRVREDVPVTSPERTLIDVGLSSEPSLAREAVNEALRNGLTTARRAKAVAAHPHGDLARAALGVRLPVVK